jgi:raffinose/stachyose/melibiose transport system substrate-binding protein
MTMSQSFLAQRAQNRLMDEYMGAVRPNTVQAHNFGSVIPNSVSEQEIGRLLPLLINGTYTPERFCQELTTRARETLR